MELKEVGQHQTYRQTERKQAGRQVERLTGRKQVANKQAAKQTDRRPRQMDTLMCGNNSDALTASAASTTIDCI